MKGIKFFLQWAFCLSFFVYSNISLAVITYNLEFPDEAFELCQNVTARQCIDYPLSYYYSYAPNTSVFTYYTANYNLCKNGDAWDNSTNTCLSSNNDRDFDGIIDSEDYYPDDSGLPNCQSGYEDDTWLPVRLDGVDRPVSTKIFGFGCLHNVDIKLNECQANEDLSTIFYKFKTIGTGDHSVDLQNPYSYTTAEGTYEHDDHYLGSGLPTQFFQLCENELNQVQSCLDFDDLNVSVAGDSWQTITADVCHNNCQYTLGYSGCANGTCTAQYVPVGDEVENCLFEDYDSIDYSQLTDTNSTPPPSTPNFDYDTDLTHPVVTNSVDLFLQSTSRSDQCYKLINCSDCSAPINPTKEMTVAETMALFRSELNNRPGAFGYQENTLDNGSQNKIYYTELDFNFKSTNAGKDSNTGTYSLVPNLVTKQKTLYLSSQPGSNWAYHEVPDYNIYTSESPEFTLQGCGFFNDNPPDDGSGSDGNGDGTVTTESCTDSNGDSVEVDNESGIKGINCDVDKSPQELFEGLQASFDGHKDNIDSEISSLQLDDFTFSPVSSPPNSFTTLINAFNPSGGDCPSHLITIRGNNSLLEQFCEKWNSDGRPIVGWFFYILTGIGIMKLFFQPKI